MNNYTIELNTSQRSVKKLHVIEITSGDSDDLQDDVFQACKKITDSFCSDSFCSDNSYRVSQIQETTEMVNGEMVDSEFGSITAGSLAVTIEGKYYMSDNQPPKAQATPAQQTSITEFLKAEMFNVLPENRYEINTDNFKDFNEVSLDLLDNDNEPAITLTLQPLGNYHTRIHVVYPDAKGLLEFAAIVTLASTIAQKWQASEETPATQCQNGSCRGKAVTSSSYGQLCEACYCDFSDEGILD
jgi:hypothetical protein